MIPKVNNVEQRSFMVWISPELHRAVKEKLFAEKLTARELVTWFLKKYTGFTGEENVKRPTENSIDKTD
jgi:hypothetical protein